MIYSLQGNLTEKRDNFFVIELGGLAFQIKSSFSVVKSLPAIGEKVKVFTYLHVREDALELYGFLNKDELSLFEMLIGISGIGPKSALNIMGVEKVEKLKAAISEGRSELLTRASGIGKKIAERVILELRGKLQQEGAGGIVGLMESDQDIVEALANLGYTKSQAKEALAKVSASVGKMEDRIKEALKLLKSR
ncbi:MAG: Holliday junction branch migration protein RuvA [Candidatus Harrisonbacteria bacterium]|nr:Holliday junction branch migration protein RuvA [Candidatus Harrisonbacteria bacterium]